MVHITRWWVAGTSAALLSLNTVHAQSVPHPMIVRVYNVAALPPEDIDGAGTVVDKIFHRAGIRVQWRVCPAVRDRTPVAENPCMEQLQPGEVIARLVAGGTDRAARVFGYALIDEGTQASTMATIFVDRISAVAARLSIGHAPLVGRTLAHELGHLLLATNSHAPHGLMRGLWPDTLMRSETGHEWTFSNREAQQMKLGLRLRTAGARGPRELQAGTVPRTANPS
jgi:hypothetical protein